MPLLVHRVNDLLVKLLSIFNQMRLKTTEFRNACAIHLLKHAQYVTVYRIQIRVAGQPHVFLYNLLKNVLILSYSTLMASLV